SLSRARPGDPPSGPPGARAKRLVTLNAPTVILGHRRWAEARVSDVSAAPHWQNERRRSFGKSLIGLHRRLLRLTVLRPGGRLPWERLRSGIDSPPGPCPGVRAMGGVLSLIADGQATQNLSIFDPASPPAQSIVNLSVLVLAITGFIFFVVEGILVYA